MKGGIVSGEVLVVAPLAGDAEGNLNMYTPTALRVIGKMALLYGTALTPYGMDSLAELANIIIGNAMSVLRDQGVQLRTLPPFVVTPGQMPVSTSLFEACRAPLVTNCGLITIHVLLNA
jgi:CheY-specific phosphatase CheX